MVDIKKKILLVEDDLAIREALSTMFTKENFAVVEAGDGEEALKIAHDQIPDVIILDLLMPKMDGMTMLKKLREDHTWGSDVPVIILTNVNTDLNLNQIIQNRPAYYLIKSDVMLSEVVAKVRNVLDSPSPVQA